MAPSISNFSSNSTPHAFRQSGVGQASVAHSAHHPFSSTLRGATNVSSRRRTVASSLTQLVAGAWCPSGLFQGLGAPSCAKLLTAWYATKERGTYWGLWNISHNLGGLSAPIITSSVAMAFGWRVRNTPPEPPPLVPPLCVSFAGLSRAKNARCNMRLVEA
eukprot:59367-Prorocentrum_minimum.AAC.3